MSVCAGAVEAFARPDFVVEVAAFLGVGVAVGAFGVEAGVVAAFNVRVGELAGCGAVGAVCAVAARGCVWVFKGTAWICA